MKKLPHGHPSINIKDSELEEGIPFLRKLINILEDLRRTIVEVVNFNSVTYYSQNGAPTTTQVLAGQMAVWKDADAGSSTPTHYLVYNDGGTILTFASEETVP